MSARHVLICWLLTTYEPAATAAHTRVAEGRRQPGGTSQRQSPPQRRPLHGYELHLAVQVRDFGYSGRPDQVVLGADVPNFVAMGKLTPAGADRVAAVTPRLLAEAVRVTGQEWAPGQLGSRLEAVLWDRGYSIQRYAVGNGALRAAGIGVVFDLSTRQRTLKATYHSIDFIDGVPFSKHMPIELRDLPRPDANDGSEEREAKLMALTRCAIWRWTPHGSSRDGTSRRWRCPFCAGRLRVAGGPARATNSSAPFVELPDGEKCCDGIVTLPDDAVQVEQASGLLWGTAAHTAVYGQRSLVENTNNLLHDMLVHLDRGYTKLFGLKKRTFVLAGVNRKIAVAWEAMEAERATHEKRLVEYEAQQRGEVTPAAPRPATLRKRRSREALRARAAAPPASSGPGKHAPSAPRIAANRQ